MQSVSGYVGVVGMDENVASGCHSEVIRRRRAALSLRVSTSDQRPALQADETGEMIARRGWELAETYIDHGVSGTRRSRPALDRMLADARRGAFDVLVVWRSDRLFRSLKHMLVTLDELAALGIDFVSATETFDTTTASGRLMFSIVSAFSQFERDVLAERTRAGMAAARRRGAKIGRPRVYVDVPKALLLRSKRVPMKEIARRLGVGLTTLRTALRDANERVRKGSPAGAADSAVISDPAEAA